MNGLLCSRRSAWTTRKWNGGTKCLKPVTRLATKAFLSGWVLSRKKLITYCGQEALGGDVAGCRNGPGGNAPLAQRIREPRSGRASGISPFARYPAKRSGTDPALESRGNRSLNGTASFPRKSPVHRLPPCQLRPRQALSMVTFRGYGTPRFAFSGSG